MQRRPEFSFAGSPARGLPPRPAGSMMATRAVAEEEARWLQASRQGSPDYGSSGGSGTPSPQLWAAHHGERHHHRMYPASAGSSPSRAQAIAGYRREMLDLVRGLPESAYELSLRDIVETSSPSPPLPLPTPPPPPPPPSNAAAQAAQAPAADTKKNTAADAEDREKQSPSKKQGRKQSTTRKQRSRSLERSVSLDTGLLIKLFMPLSVGRGDKKKVSPKPDAAAKEAKKKEKEKKKQGTKKEHKDEEWWTKSEFSEAGGSSRTSSTGSSNSSAGSSNSSAGSIRNGSANGHGHGGSNPRAPVRDRNRKRIGCYAFFRANIGQNRASQD